MRPRALMRAAAAVLAPLLLPLMSGGCASDLTVSGVVRDAYTLQPITSAVVQVGVRSTRTDETGRYALEGIEGWEVDPVSILVTATGYDPIRDLRHVDADGDAEAYLVFNLRPGASKTIITTTQPASAPRWDTSGGASVETQVTEVQLAPSDLPPIQERAERAD